MATESQFERQLLTKYVTTGKLMQVASIDADGMPMLCHVWYAATFSPDRLYFISRHDRDHSVNIRANSQVSGGIVAIELTGLGQKVQGVTFKGTATQLPIENLDASLALFHDRWPAARNIINSVNLVNGETPSRLYEIRISEWRLFDDKNFPSDPLRVMSAE